MRKLKIFIIATLFLTVSSFCYSVSAGEWKPVAGILQSKFAPDVKAEAVLPEYPRPQMVRDQWQGLNGLWNYAIAPVATDKVPEMQGEILVPFAIESSLSGVAKRVGKDNNLWYKRTFSVPDGWKGQRILLHFGAVDWRCKVFVNGQEVGKHEGGYVPFVFDITSALKNNAKEELVVQVWDPTNDGPQPIGKQHNNPHGIWYTPVTGIWQTVWMEPVAETSITKVNPVATINKEGKDSVTFTVTAQNAKPGDTVRVSGSFNGKEEEVTFKFDGNTAKGSFTWAKGQMKYWTPDTPVLYPVKVSIIRSGKAVDSVDSYFALRSISLGKKSDGIVRLLLNDEFVFQHGPLDQGWWPDGLYTAPTDKALIFDIEMTKKFGFNMLRKHVKVEPARFYYHCDRLGMMVWQDMPSGDTKNYISSSAPTDSVRTPETAAVYENELKELINAFDVYPSIIMWVPFNEGWGQFDTPRIVDMVRKLDPSRLVNNTSGWTDRLCGDVFDTHSYPGPDMTYPELNRAVVLGEYGGLGLPIKGHSWNDEGKNWGYVSFKDKEGLLKRYEELHGKLRPLIAKGLSAAVYTQTTDVEIEINGLMSYDRKVVKMAEDKVAKTNLDLRKPVSDEERAKAFADSAWNGYKKYDILFRYRRGIVVAPKQAAPGNPWIWRARFWGHEPQTDLALLERGFHLVYLDTAPQLGSPLSVSLWQDFYLWLTQNVGLAKKCHLEGMSRGGLYIMNWAVEYPNQIASIYLDNPVLNVKSWPGNFLSGPGSKNDWNSFLKSYNLKEEDAKNFKKSPVDTCEKLAQNKVPILLVNGDADKTVPFEENGKILIEKYKAANGPIEVIMKPGCDHHPHSLKDPKPIVDFILKHEPTIKQ